MTLEIRLATANDINAVIEHDQRHLKEPGFNGSLAHPFLPDHEFDWESKKIQKLLGWTKPITEEGWLRHFILVDNSSETVLGHLDLKNIFAGTLHRAQLGMGLEVNVRGQGHGKKLLEFAISWANSEATLAWIDLSCFAHNTPARKLYASCGFVELFTYPDRLRVGPHHIDDVYMTLKLKN